MSEQMTDAQDENVAEEALREEQSIGTAERAVREQDELLDKDPERKQAAASITTAIAHEQGAAEIIATGLASVLETSEA